MGVSLRVNGFLDYHNESVRLTHYFEENSRPFDPRNELPGKHPGVTRFGQYLFSGVDARINNAGVLSDFPYSTVQKAQIRGQNSRLRRRREQGCRDGGTLEEFLLVGFSQAAQAVPGENCQ